MLIILILLAAIFNWSVFGFFFYMVISVGDEKPNLPLAAICGPAAWVLVIYYYTLYKGVKWG